MKARYDDIASNGRKCAVKKRSKEAEETVSEGEEIASIFSQIISVYYSVHMTFQFP
jgi:hypothetical protein